MQRFFGQVASSTSFISLFRKPVQPIVMDVMIGDRRFEATRIIW